MDKAASVVDAQQRDMHGMLICSVNYHAVYNGKLNVLLRGIVVELGLSREIAISGVVSKRPCDICVIIQGGYFVNKSGFSKLFWGFLFIMIDFKIQGFDILPDIIGYILFAFGFSILAESSMYFVKARNFNIPMIILSIFSIYEKPAQGEGIQLGPLGPFGILISIAALVVGLLVVYNLFMGIKDMAEKKLQMDIYEEAGRRWNQYLLLQLAAILVFVLIFIPPLALAYIFIMLIASIAITILIMQFMTRCGERL